MKNKQYTLNEIEMETREETDKIKSTISTFLKESWRIDGSVKVLGMDSLLILGTHVMVFELTDTNRGTFTVCIEV